MSVRAVANQSAQYHSVALIEYEGVLAFKGEPLRDLSEIELTNFVKILLDLSSKNFNLIHQSVLDNVKLPLYVKDLSDKEMTQG